MKNNGEHIVHLRQECHNSKFVIFQEKLFKILKCYNFLWVQRRHNCCPAASFANCFLTLHLLKVHLQTFLSIRITQKCHILSFDTLVANERYYVGYWKKNVSMWTGLIWLRIRTSEVMLWKLLRIFRYRKIREMNCWATDRLSIRTQFILIFILSNVCILYDYNGVQNDIF